MQNVSSPETIQITDSRYTDYKSPYPYFGGKSTVADVIWDRFGADVTNFVDPFFGSNAVLLGRPGWHPGQTYFETLNDKSAYIANFWRAIMYDPEQTAFYADWPSNENDHDVRKWALENGNNPMFRIAVCGYESEDYNFPSTWESYAWKANGGFGNQRGKRGKDNANRERIWFSPHCNKPKAGWIARSFFE